MRILQARFVVRAAVIAALVVACAPSETQTDVARAMCIKNIMCANFYDTVNGCTARVAATMPPAACTASELDACERAIDVEACRSPEAALPVECGPCE